MYKAEFKAALTTVFAGVVKQSEYFLANHEIQWDAPTASMIDAPGAVRSDAVFVAMPAIEGSWVHSPDEVLRLLRHNSATKQPRE